MTRIIEKSIDKAAVSCFVAEHPDSVQGHRIQWSRILQQSMKHQPAHLVAERDGQVVGWLPMMSVKSFIFGRYLCSMPYVNEAGVLADEPETTALLLDHALNRVKHEKPKRFELRHRRQIEHPSLMPTRTEKVSSRLTLPDDEDGLWKLPPAKVRNQVRKAQKFEINIRWGGSELLPAFYHVFTTNMRDLGSPAFPKSLFSLMLDEFQQDAEICVLMHKDQPISGAILIHDPAHTCTEVPSASCLRSANPMCANMLMYFHLLLRAIKHGSSTFDFGRSTRDSGTHKFKKQWRSDSFDTGWQTLNRPTGENVIRKEDGAYGRATQIWQKLPVGLTKVIGPKIVRGIP